jgi:TolB-like protein/DNA-binding SARP family transcriptional activator
MVSLHLFGDAVVETDQGRVTGRCAQRHQVALLALLATAPRLTLSRDKLIGLLWPGSDTKHARNLLNVAAYTVRRALGDDALQSVGDGIELPNARWHVDVREFETALAADDFERAVSLYRGPFLDGFFLTDAPEFNHWQDGERDRLARKFGRALQALATSAETEGDVAKAAEWWRSVAAHDPLDSLAAMGLMRALARAGNPAAAVHHAQAHAALLRDELGVEPSDEVTAFAATLSRGEVAVATVPRALSAVSLLPQRVGPRLDRQLDAQLAETHADMSQRGTAGTDATDRAAPYTAAPPSRLRRRSLRRAGARTALIVLPLALAGYVAASLGRAGDAARSQVAAADGNTGAAAVISSIAVLPFMNVGGDTANQYFADGLTDELTTALQKVPGLRVLSRRSAFAFRDSAGMDVRQIGRRLGVGAILEGTTRRAGTRLRVTAQVTSVRDGRALWSQAYERDREDVVAIQEEIVRAAAGALSITVSTDGGSLAIAGTKSVDAHELYLRGRFLFNNAQSEQSLRQSIAFYEHAIAVDRNYALAWSGIADSWAMLADWYVTPNDAYPRAKTAALTALAIDSALAEAHVVLGAVQAAYDWDFAAADRSVVRAMALSPNSANVLAVAMWPSLASGALDSAVSMIRRARALDPLSASTGYFACWALTAARLYDEAIGEARKMLGVNAQEPLAFWALGEALSAQGRHAEALAFFQRAAPLGPMPRLDLARTLAALGRREEALRLVRELEREGERRYVSPASIAMVYVHLGDHDTAFLWLERAYRLRSAHLTSLRHQRVWDPVRNDPRFQAIVRRVWDAG